MWREQDTLFWGQIKQRHILLLIFIHTQTKISSLLGESQLEYTSPTGKMMRREKDEDSGGLLKLTGVSWNNNFQIKVMVVHILSQIFPYFNVLQFYVFFE